MNMVEQEVVVIGAGIAGLATAVALRRVGINPLVLEKSDGLRATGAAINLAPNAWRALGALGVSHKLTSLYAPVKRGFVTDLGTGATQEFSYEGAFGSGPVYVYRKSLLKALADELATDTIRFSSKIAAIDSQTRDGSSPVAIHLADGTTIKAKVLIGCDGVHSKVARWLGLSEPINSGRAAGLGMAVYPQGHGLNKELRQFLGVGLRAGFVPLNDKEIYWFLICDSPKGENKTVNLEHMQKEILEIYAKVLPPLYLDIVEHSDPSTLHWAPLMFRQPWNILFGNIHKGNVTVIGDAMHPMTPDLGQGGCSALEDAVVIGRHISGSLLKNKGLVAAGESGIAQAMDGFVKERKWRVAALFMGSYLSGWIQHDGSKWWMKFLRDVIFYRLLFGIWVPKIAGYDCGELPDVSFKELNDSRKRD